MNSFINSIFALAREGNGGVVLATAGNGVLRLRTHAEQGGLLETRIPLSEMGGCEIIVSLPEEGETMMLKDLPQGETYVVMLP